MQLSQAGFQFRPAGCSFVAGGRLGFGVPRAVGADGDGWGRLSLVRQGYRDVATARASSATEAIELLYGRRQHSGASV